nr:hypothetical protein [Sphingopyxis panaciterrulae]
MIGVQGHAEFREGFIARPGQGGRDRRSTTQLIEDQLGDAAGIAIAIAIAWKLSNLHDQRLEKRTDGMDDGRGGKPRAGVLHDPEAAKFGAGQRADAMGHTGGKPYRLVGRDDEGTTGYRDGEHAANRIDQLPPIVGVIGEIAARGKRLRTHRYRRGRLRVRRRCNRWGRNWLPGP